MLPKIVRTCVQITSRRGCKIVRSTSHNVNSKIVEKQIGASSSQETEVLDTHLINTYSDNNIMKEKRRSVLEQCDEDISYVAPYLQPTFNFAAYVNKSETLQELLKMGVNLYKVERMKDAVKYILGLNFENDIKKHIIFFHNLGLSVDAIANVITKNPFIFKEDIDNLEVRVNYLKYKKFTDEMILRIIEKNPSLLSNDTPTIDKMFGFLMKSFALTANELRNVTTKKPKLINYNRSHITTNIFVVKEEMGFTPDQMKIILLKCPPIFMKNQNFILKTFEYIHKEMNVELETILEFPEVLTCRHYRIKQRHLFLEKLGRAQFDPKKPNYVSLSSLVTGDDSYFSTEIAKSSIQTFNAFLKTM